MAKEKTARDEVVEMSLGEPSEEEAALAACYRRAAQRGRALRQLAEQTSQAQTPSIPNEPKSPLEVVRHSENERPLRA